MDIGIPTETKIMEGRVALVPAVCQRLVEQGLNVFLQHNAGSLSGYSDADYEQVGVTIVDDAASLFASAELIVKVKEPTAADLEHIKAKHVLFCFLHLAASPALLAKLCDIGCTALAFESVVVDNQRPILAPMSQIAGRIAVQVGCHLLHQPLQGKGILLGGLSFAKSDIETDKGHVVVLGGGIAGQQSAELALSIGADVTLMDINQQRLAELKEIHPRLNIELADHLTIAKAVKTADLLIGAVLIPDKHAPKLVTADMVKTMEKGSVVVDIAIDQGGCIETIKATTYAEPTYFEYGVLHFGVTNMPGAVPRTASQALSSVIETYVYQLAHEDWRANPALLESINIQDGEVVLEALKSL